MSSKVTVNGLGLTYKSSLGISTATIPDVCKTPSPAGPVPIPYPNIATQSSLKGGTKSVKVKGKMIAVKGSQYGSSNGDEAGTAGGLKSSVNMKATDWITYSFDVKMDGKNACRHTDKKFHNNKNTADLAGNIDPVMPAGLSAADRELWTDCKELHDSYKEQQGNASTHNHAEYQTLKASFRGDSSSAGQRERLFQIAHEKLMMVEQELKERIKYVKMGCDKFDWFNSGTTTADRRASHDGQIGQVRQYATNLKELQKGLW